MNEKRQPGFGNSWHGFAQVCFGNQFKLVSTWMHQKAFEAARAGLFRWDGLRWSRPAESFSLPREEPPVRLLVDARRRLWIA